MRLYLASRSPRRRELLHQMGIDFDTLVFRDGGRADFEIDETPYPGEDPLVYVERVARAKSEHGQKIVNERKLPQRPILSADTTLEFAGEIIGKPVDAADATAILQRLSGQTHRVLTGVSVTTMGRDRVCPVFQRGTFSSAGKRRNSPLRDDGRTDGQGRRLRYPGPRRNFCRASGRELYRGHGLAGL
jgi:predicted house-cleaning NTP pyrophosphatase (Maf/HAM1 superfamily)